MVVRDLDWDPHVLTRMICDGRRLKRRLDFFSKKKTSNALVSFVFTRASVSLRKSASKTRMTGSAVSRTLLDQSWKVTLSKKLKENWQVMLLLQNCCCWNGRKFAEWQKCCESIWRLDRVGFCRQSSPSSSSSSSLSTMELIVEVRPFNRSLFEIPFCAY